MASEYAKAKLKAFAKEKLNKFFEDDEPKPPPNPNLKPPAVYPPLPTNQDDKPPQSSGYPPAQHHDDLASSFQSMSISGGSGQQQQPGFIGGFTMPRPASLPPPEAELRPNSLTPPNVHRPHSDQPMSLTMQYALQAPSSGPAFPSPNLQSPYLTAPPGPRPASDSALDTAQQSNSLSAPRPKRPRASSAGVSSKDSFTVQCAATTKAGAPCKRQVKLNDALFRAYESAVTDGEDFEVFCGQHQDIVNQNTHVQSRKKPSVDVKFNEWAPLYLQAATRASIISEMSKPRSQSDRPGIIYCFEIIEDPPGNTVKLKVGRTVNLGKRISEWDAQCGSKKQVLRYYCPNDGQAVPLLKGTLKSDKTLAWCYRAERLIHLELGDLVTSKAYLDPDWPNTSTVTTTSSNGSSLKQPCLDCGKRHKEIFEFTRLKGKAKGREWELIVQPVVEKWGRFVDDHLE